MMSLSLVGSDSRPANITTSLARPNVKLHSCYALRASQGKRQHGLDMVNSECSLCIAAKAVDPNRHRQ